MMRRSVWVLLAISVGCQRPAKPLGEAELAKLKQAGEALGHGDWPLADRLAGELAKRSKTAGVLLVQGIARLRDGRAREAAQALDQAQRLDPANADVAAARVRAHLAAGGVEQAKKALAIVQATAPQSDAFLLAVRAGDGDPMKTAEALLRIGQAALRDRRSDDALGAFQEAAVLAPKAANAHLLLGSAYYNLKNYPKAVVALGQATTLEPRTVGAWKLLGHSYAQMQDKAKAIEAYRRVAELAPSDPDAPASIARLEGRPPPAPPTPAAVPAPVPPGPGTHPPAPGPAPRP